MSCSDNIKEQTARLSRSLMTSPAYHCDVVSQTCKAGNCLQDNKRTGDPMTFYYNINQSLLLASKVEMRNFSVYHRQHFIIIKQISTFYIKTNIICILCSHVPRHNAW